MKHGDISNKPAQQLMFRLEQIADEIKISRFTKKLTIEVDSQHIIYHLNLLFLRRDIQIVIGVVLPKKYQTIVEDYLDSIDLLYKEVILAETEEEMEEIIKREGIEAVENLHTFELLWT